MARPDPCQLCGRNGRPLTQHHLIPKTRRRSRRVRKRPDRDELRRRVLWVCADCHRQLHAVLTEKELAEDYNTPEALAAHPEVARFIEWVRDHAGAAPLRVRRMKNDEPRDKKRRLAQRRRARRGGG